MRSFKKLLALMLALMTVIGVTVLITACDGGNDGGDGGNGSGDGNQSCTEHKDVDGDELCDDCGAEVPAACVHIDADYNELCDECGEQYFLTVDFTITIKDEAGAGVEGVSVTLLKDETEVVTLTTNFDGKVSGSVKAGRYTVNAEGLPEYWYSDASFVPVEINAENKSFAYTAIDNTPTGTADNPFLAENASTGEGASVNMPAGAEYVFTVKGTATRYLVIENASVKVTYGGTEYTAEAGVLRVLFTATADTNTSILFTVTNTSAEQNTVKLNFEGLPGSMDNPYEAVLDTETAVSIAEEGTVYYTYTASATGMLMVKSETATNNISMYNTTSYVVTGYTNGSLCEYVYVTAGDVVNITVALTEGAPATDVVFTLSHHTGAAADPIPVYETASLRMLAGATYCLVYHGDGASVTIPAASLTVALNGTAATATGNSYVLNVAEGDVIVITNGGERADAEIKITE